MAGLALPLPGCRRDDASTFNIRGRVTYEGKELENGTVMLQPVTGKSVIGVIRDDGSFEARAAAGAYRVGVVSLPAIPDDVDVWKPGAKLPKSPLPVECQRPEDSGIKIDVATNDDNIANIELPLKQVN